MIEPAFLQDAAVNHVGLFLLLFCGLLLIQFGLAFRDQFRFFRSRPRALYPRRWLLGRYPMPWLSERQFLLAGTGFAAGLAGAMLGLWPRASLAVALVAYFGYFSQIIPLDYVRRKANLLPIVLAILCVAPGTGAPLDQPAPLWPLWLVKLALTQMYFSSGLQKLRRAGWRWADGRTLQAYAAASFLSADNKGAWWLATHPGACRVLSVLTLAFELTFGAILVFPELTYWYAAFGVLFHAGTALAMRIHYLKYLGPVYTVFLTELVFAVTAP